MDVPSEVIARQLSTAYFQPWASQEKKMEFDQESQAKLLAYVCGLFDLTERGDLLLRQRT